MQGDIISLRAGDGDDVIRVRADYARVEAGEGNNIIDFKGSGEVFSGSGNDQIAISGYSQLYVAGGDNVVVQTGRAYTGITLGDGNDVVRLQRGGASTGGGNDVIYSSSNNRFSGNSVNAGAGDDRIYSTDVRIGVSGGAGNDRVEARGYVSFNGGAGDDYVYSSGGSVTFRGGDGNDYASGTFLGTIDGGRGDDYFEERVGLRGSRLGNNIYFRAGDGNDVLDLKGYRFALENKSQNAQIREYFGTRAELRVLNLEGYSVDDVQTQRDGADLVVSFKGSTDSITFKGFSETDALFLKTADDVTSSFKTTNILRGDGKLLSARETDVGYKIDARQVENFLTDEYFEVVGDTRVDDTTS